MEFLFSHLERTVKAIQSLSLTWGFVILLIAFLLYMWRSITPWDYSVNFLKVFLLIGFCIGSPEVFRFAEGVGMSIARTIEPKIATDPFQFASGLLITQETAEKIDRATEENEQAATQNQPSVRDEQNSGVLNRLSNGINRITSAAKTFGSAIVHPIETGKKVISSVYGSIFKVVLHLFSWLGALIIIATMVIQYAICVCLRMFLPLAFACLAVPPLVNMGMNFLQTGVNVICWPIGFAIVQKMIGSIILDTQIASVVNAATLGEMEGSVMIHACGVLAVACLGTFGYLAVPKIVAIFVGGGLAGSGLTNAMSSALGGAVGGAVGSSSRAFAGGIGSAGKGAGGKAGGWLKGKFGQRQNQKQMTEDQMQRYAQEKRKEFARSLAVGTTGRNIGGK